MADIEAPVEKTEVKAEAKAEATDLKVFGRLSVADDLEFTLVRRMLSLSFAVGFLCFLRGILGFALGDPSFGSIVLMLFNVIGSIALPVCAYRGVKHNCEKSLKVFTYGTCVVPFIAIINILAVSVMHANIMALCGGRFCPIGTYSGYVGVAITLDLILIVVATLDARKGFEYLRMKGYTVKVELPTNVVKIVDVKVAAPESEEKIEAKVFGRFEVKTQAEFDVVRRMVLLSCAAGFLCFIRGILGFAMGDSSFGSIVLMLSLVIAGLCLPACALGSVEKSSEKYSEPLLKAFTSCTFLCPFISVINIIAMSVLHSKLMGMCRGNICPIGGYSGYVGVAVVLDLIMIVLATVAAREGFKYMKMTGRSLTLPVFGKKEEQVGVKVSIPSIKVVEKKAESQEESWASNVKRQDARNIDYQNSIESLQSVSCP